jgi:hypothetical protein
VRRQVTIPLRNFGEDEGVLTPQESPVNRIEIQTKNLAA